MSDFGTHEILDRAALAHHFFNDNVLEHSRLREFPNLRRMAIVADTALAEFYQACGQEFHGDRS